jgi:hypothetical protein
MRKSGILSAVFAVLPGILGIAGLVLHYTGMEFAWIVAAAALVCMFLAVVTTIFTSFFTGPWYIILLFNLLAVYILVFLTPVILNAIHKIRQTDKA